MKNTFLVLAVAILASAAPLAAQSFDTADYKINVVTVADGLAYPYSFAFLPDGGILVTEMKGGLRMVRNGKLLPEPVAQIPNVHFAAGRGGFMDIIVHPKFAQNHWVLFTYDKEGEKGATQAIGRGTLEGNKLTDIRDIFVTDNWGKAEGHLSARINFGRDGMLYMAISDHNVPANVPLNTSHAGKVIRMKEDGTGAEIYATGFRDPHAILPIPGTDDFWEVEHGDELNRVTKGGNYGWPFVSSGEGNPIGPPPAGVKMTEPYVKQWPVIHVSGLTYYNGDKFPKWKGNLFIGCLETQEVHRVALGKDAAAKRETVFKDLGQRVRSIHEGPDGFIYFTTDNATGRLMRIEPASASAQEKGGDDRSGPYDAAAGWPLPLPDKGYIWGSTGGIFAESPNRIFIANRGELKLPEKLPANFNGYWGSLGEQATNATPIFKNCIVVVDSTGKLVEAWTKWDHLFEDGRGPHSVLISPYDPDHNVWVVDDVHHQIFKFTNDGKEQLMSLGVRDEPGNDDRHFKRPTDIAWLPDGTLFVSDGYGNTRVAKFDKNGKFLLAWGTPGTGNGEFNTPHSITIDKNRRVYVSDRANNRIQVFDENGKYLDQWPNITQPYHIRVSDDGYLWAFSGPLDKFLKYDLNGHLLYSWGTHGTAPGMFWAVHEFSADSDGNLYTAEVFGGRPQKFKPRQGADSAHLYKPVPLMRKAR